ncbi:hypothetical protein [Nocardia arizonensis]|uniref:hypothetical protein n=1 Tax=Nocardia arizonensis TaxID=1141647 RepID=UPI000A67D299|nr:hypothetical protein [Nocardia arizonensis]
MPERSADPETAGAQGVSDADREAAIAAARGALLVHDGLLTRGIPRALGFGIAAVAIVVCAAVLGALNPPVPSGISTDRLGPETGEPVADYLARARESLEGADTGDHWALVSFTEEIPAARITDMAGGLRVAQAVYRVPVPDVRTPIVAVQLPAGDAVARESATAAAWQLTADLEQTTVTADDRYRRTLTVSIHRLRAGCACAVGLVVRGAPPRLRTLATAPGIRAVQALPADAVAGSFAVVPLLPSQRTLALPDPDTAPVPEF